MATFRSGDTLVAIAIPALAFAVVPGAGAPFSTPKHWVLIAAAALAVIAAAFARGPAVGFSRLAAPVAVGALAALSALNGPLTDPRALRNWLAAVALTVAVAHLGVRPRVIVRALAWTGAGIALVALAQLAGWDPFRWLGFSPQLAGQRMTAYATLGNPDFAAAWLVPTACATVAEIVAEWGRGRFAHRGRETAPTGPGTSPPDPAHPRRWVFAGWSLALLLQLGALCGLASYASLLALGAALVVLAAVRKLSRRGVVTGVLALLAVALGLVGRPVESRIAGRLYLLRVAAPHLVDAPWLGQGPGSVAALWPAWEVERLRPTDARFAGPERHTHDDFLELALELGLPAALALLVWIAQALALGLRGPWEPDRLALACALAGLAARAWVDFPLARPAGLGLFAVLTAVLLTAPAAQPVEKPCPTASDPFPSPLA